MTVTKRTSVYTPGTTIPDPPGFRFVRSGLVTAPHELGLSWSAPTGATLVAVSVNSLGNYRGLYLWPETAPTPWAMEPSDKDFRPVSQV